MASSLISCRFTSSCPEGFLTRCDVFRETTRQLSRYGKIEWIVVPFLFRSFLRMEMCIVWHTHYDACEFEQRLDSQRNVTVAGIASCGNGFRLQVSRVQHLTHRSHYFAEEHIYPDNICFRIDNDMVWETYILPHGLASERVEATEAATPDTNDRDSNHWLQGDSDNEDHDFPEDPDDHQEQEEEEERWNTQQAFIQQAEEWYGEQREHERKMRQELSPAEFRLWKSTQGPRSTTECRYEMYLRDGVLYC
jgi:hypothetical protein